MFVTRVTRRGATCGAETAYPSGAPEFTPSFSGIRVARSSVLGVIVCPLFSVPFGHCVVCPSIAVSKYPFSILFHVIIT